MRLACPSSRVGPAVGARGARVARRVPRHARGVAPKRAAARACGIFGVFRTDGEAAPEIYEALMMLQHRGQDAAGMVTYDGRRFVEHKGKGLVSDVFKDKEVMKELVGSIGIGHVRYPTAGSLNPKEAQPFFVNSPFGIWLIHNGNLTNTEELREDLQRDSDNSYHRHMRTDSDTEVLLNVLADSIHRSHKESGMRKSATELVFEGAKRVMRKVRGAYSVITTIDEVGLMAFRDPNGIRPMVLGKRVGINGPEYAFASEDAAFGPLGFERVRDVAPGEAVLITLDGEIKSKQLASQTNLTPCIFEYIYLSRPDSTLNGISVYNFQLALGRRLADRIRERWQDIDVIVPVPDGSRPSAIELSAALGLPYREGLVKNRYVGRTFIMPSQRMRELSVRRKLNAMSAVFEGKNVLLVDDSIVRGTTMRQIVEMCKRAGAKKVYIASASPPVVHPNVYGVDLPSRKEFIANEVETPPDAEDQDFLDELATVLSADGLIYQTMPDLVGAGKDCNPNLSSFDCSVFDGKYVTGDVDEEYLEALEKTGRGAARQKSQKLVGSIANAAAVAH